MGFPHLLHLLQNEFCGLVRSTNGTGGSNEDENATLYTEHTNMTATKARSKEKRIKTNNTEIKHRAREN